MYTMPSVPERTRRDGAASIHQAEKDGHSPRAMLFEAGVTLAAFLTLAAIVCLGLSIFGIR